MTSKVLLNISEPQSFLLLAFVGGFIDAAGYVKLQQVFTSSITGNLVAALSSIYVGTYGVLCRFLIAVFFFLGAALLTGISMRLKIVEGYNIRTVGIILYTFLLLAFVGSMIAGLVLNNTIDESQSLDDWAVILVACLLGFTMGLHSAAGKEVLPGCPSLTVITMTMVTVAGNLTTTIIYTLAHWSIIKFYPKSDGNEPPENYKTSILAKQKDSHDKLHSSATLLIAFLVGALLGAVLISKIQFYSTLIPIGIILSLIIDMYCGLYYKNPITWSAIYSTFSSSKQDVNDHEKVKNTDEDRESEILGINK